MSTKKHEYGWDEVKASFSLRPYMIPQSEDDACQLLLDYAKTCVDVRDLIAFSLDNGLFAHLRRNSFLFISVVRENQRFGLQTDVKEEITF